MRRVEFKDIKLGEVFFGEVITSHVWYIGVLTASNKTGRAEIFALREDLASGISWIHLNMDCVAELNFYVDIQDLARTIFLKCLTSFGIDVDEFGYVHRSIYTWDINVAPLSKMMGVNICRFNHISDTGVNLRLQPDIIVDYNPIADNNSPYIGLRSSYVCVLDIEESEDMFLEQHKERIKDLTCNYEAVRNAIDADNLYKFRKG